MPEVAEQIATRLRADESALAQIKQIVWDLGRTQSQALCAEVLQGGPEEGQGDQAFAEQFFSLVKRRGVNKQRPRHLRPDFLTSTPPRNQDGAREKEAARLIANQLGERDGAVRQTILRSVRVIGVEMAFSLLQRTHEVEGAGGMMVQDQSRRRMPCGVYLWLLKQHITANQRRRIFQGNDKKAAQGSVSNRPGLPAPLSHQGSQAALPLPWPERGAIISEAEKKPGVTTVAKVVLIGRPGSIAEHGKYVTLGIQQRENLPGLPGDLPLPPEEASRKTRYLVSALARHWRKATADPAGQESEVFIEGFPMMDAEQGVIALFASNLMVKPGVTATAKMTLIGRPGSVVERGKCVIFGMQQREAMPRLPGDLPLPSEDASRKTRYLVYALAKHWRKAIVALEDQEDEVFVEGFPVVDIEQGVIALFASTLSTKKHKQAQRQPKD